MLGVSLRNHKVHRKKDNIGKSAHYNTKEVLHVAHMSMGFPMCLLCPSPGLSMSCHAWLGTCRLSPLDGGGVGIDASCVSPDISLLKHPLNINKEVTTLRSQLKTRTVHQRSPDGHDQKKTSTCLRTARPLKIQCECME